MNKVLILAAGLLAGGVSALPAAATGIGAAAYDWSGFYLGANGGWGSSGNCWSFVNSAGTVTAFEGCHDGTGVIAGGQIGYRWQSDGWVFGLEAQAGWANRTGGNVSLAFPVFINESRLEAFGLVTGHVGYAWDNTLLYVKGGAAVTSDSYRSLVTATGVQVTEPVSETRWGGVLGTGLEYGFAPNWSLGVEYNHLFMGGNTLAFINNGVAGTAGTLFGRDKISQNADFIAARINFRWGN